jgi:hypothetical protein
MVSNNCYSISISATPYDELSGNIEYGTKKIIKLGLVKTIVVFNILKIIIY